MKLKYLSLILVLVILGGCTPTESIYPFTTIGSVLADPEAFAGRKIRLSGTYRRDPRLEVHEISGFLQDEGNEIRVRGQVLDWIPPERTTLQFWGEIILENTEPVLVFHNGRGLGNIFRHPQPLPSLEENERVQTRGRLQLEADIVVLITEDLKKIKLEGVAPPADLPLIGEIDGQVVEKDPPDFDFTVQVEKISTYPYPPD